MRRRRLAFLVGLCLLGVAAAGWALGLDIWLPGSGDNPDAVRRGAAEKSHEGPLLAGRAGRKGGGGSGPAEGDFRIPGVVLDEHGKPAADVPVTARRTGDAPDEDDPTNAGSSWSRERLDGAFQEPEATPEEAAPVASARTAADGTFALLVHRHGVYEVRAEPTTPRTGTHDTWPLGRLPPASPMTLYVFPGSALAGRVVDGHGQGLAAAVSAVHTVYNAADWAAAETRTAPPTGAFRFEAVPDGPLDLTVRLPGKARLGDWRVEMPHPAELLLTVGDLVPLLSGHVRDPAGKPVAGAHVGVSLQVARASEGPQEALYLATSDAEGRYAVSGPLGGKVGEVEADAPGCLYRSEKPPLAKWSGLALAPGREATLDLLLYRGGVLEGQVRERGTGTALAGAVVEVYPGAVDAHLDHVRYLGARADAEGRYRVEGLPLGQSLLVVRHPTHYLPELESVMRMDDEHTGNGGMPRGLAVFVFTDGQHVTRDLEMLPGLSLAGRVVDDDDGPVADAQVFARNLGLGWRARESWGLQADTEGGVLATSDAQGRFRIGSLAPRPDWVLYAVKRPLVGEESEPMTLAAGSDAAEVTLHLRRGATLAGRVADAQGTPRSGVLVSGWSNNDDSRYDCNPPDVRTGADGTFRMEGFAPGKAALRVDDTEGSVSQDVEDIKPGEVREGLVLGLASAVLVSGTLVDEAGAPAAAKSLAFVVQVEGRGSFYSYCNTRGDGTFRCGVSMPGSCRIMSESDWSAPLATVEVPASGVRVVWKEPSRTVVEGTVVDPQGRPVPLCAVTLGHVNEPEREGNYAPSDHTAAVNGWFRRSTRGGPPVRIDVSQPRDADGRPLNLRPATVTVTEANPTPLTIILEPGLAVSGRVVDGAGRGVANVHVAVGDASMDTGPDGAFLLGGLEDVGGDGVTLSVSPPRPFVVPEPVPVKPGSDDVVVRLKVGLTVAGRVVGDAGEPWTTADVNASWAKGASHPEGSATAHPDRLGRFRIESVPEGAEVTLSVEPELDDAVGFAPHTLRGVRPGSQDVVIDLAKGALLEGHVVDAKGAPFTEGSLTVSQGEEEHEWSLGAEGAFRLRGLAAGRWELKVGRGDGGPGAAMTVDLPATGLRVVMPPTKSVQGRIDGAGALAQKFAVWAWRVEEPGAESVELGRVVPDPEGRFTLTGMGTTGRWMVAAMRQGDERFALAGPLALGTEEVVLTLRQGRSLEGTLLDGEGKPPKRGVSVALAGNGWSERIATDAEGRFRFLGLPPGRYTLTADSETPSGQSTRAEAQDVEAGRADVRLTLVPTER